MNKNEDCCLPRNESSSPLLTRWCCWPINNVLCSLSQMRLSSPGWRAHQRRTRNREPVPSLLHQCTLPQDWNCTTSPHLETLFCYSASAMMNEPTWSWLRFWTNVSSCSILKCSFLQIHCWKMLCIVPIRWFFLERHAPLEDVSLCVTLHRLVAEIKSWKKW